MLILLKFKQEFKKIKSNLHPIFRCQYHLYMPIFLWEWNPVFFQACQSLFRCYIRPLAILGR